MSLHHVHKSLHRPHLFLGVDRDLAMYTILISIITAAGGYTLISLIAGVVFLLVSFRFLRVWAKKDPLLRQVFVRYVWYVRRSALWSAKPSAFSRPPSNLWRRK